MDPRTSNKPPQDDTRVISTSTRLTIETIADCAQRIRQGLTEATTVVIAFEPEMEIDITALQLFCSACATAAAEGKHFLYQGQLPQALLDLLTAAGAERHEHCSKNHNTTCFRLVGGQEQWQN